MAGVAALIVSANADLTAQQVHRILQETTDKIVDPEADQQLGLRGGTYDSNGHCVWFGYGKVNAAKAVRVAQQLRATATSPSGELRSRWRRNFGFLIVINEELKVR